MFSFSYNKWHVFMSACRFPDGWFHTKCSKWASLYIVRQSELHGTFSHLFRSGLRISNRWNAPLDFSWRPSRCGVRRRSSRHCLQRSRRELHREYRRVQQLWMQPVASYYIANAMATRYKQSSENQFSRARLGTQPALQWAIARL